MSNEVAPDYRQLMEEIRDAVASGEYPVGTPIPSTRAMIRAGRSVTVIRRAVLELQAEGILEGRPGKGVFVRAVPEEAARERASVEELSRQVAELRHLAERDGLDEVRAAVGRLEANLIELYGKLGFDYPQGGAHDGKRAAAGRGRTRR